MAAVAVRNCVNVHLEPMLLLQGDLNATSVLKVSPALTRPSGLWLVQMGPIPLRVLRSVFLFLQECMRQEKDTQQWCPARMVNTLCMDPKPVSSVPLVTSAQRSI